MNWREADNRGVVVAVSMSPGGIPKVPVERAAVIKRGIAGDSHAHDKHNCPDRALSLLDEEIIDALRSEGYPVVPGASGENITLRGVGVQRLPPGTRLRFSGGVEIELVEPRKPCYVLDAIHPSLKQAIVSRCGYMARVIREGVLSPGEEVTVIGLVGMAVS